MGELHVGTGVMASFGERHDVVQAPAAGIWMLCLRVHRLLAQLACPAVPLKDLAVPEGFGDRRRQPRTAPLGASATVLVDAVRVVARPATYVELLQATTARTKPGTDRPTLRYWRVALQATAVPDQGLVVRPGQVVAGSAAGLVPAPITAEDSVRRPLRNDRPAAPHAVLQRLNLCVAAYAPVAAKPCCVLSCLWDRAAASLTSPALATTPTLLLLPRHPLGGCLRQVDARFTVSRAVHLVSARRLEDRGTAWPGAAARRTLRCPILTLLSPVAFRLAEPRIGPLPRKDRGAASLTRPYDNSQRCPSRSPQFSSLPPDHRRPSMPGASDNSSGTRRRSASRSGSAGVHVPRAAGTDGRDFLPASPTPSTAPALTAGAIIRAGTYTSCR